MSRYERALRRLLASTTRPKLGLERMTTLLERLENPQCSWPALHIAGTKGKGSTAAFAAAMCRAAGLHVGLTTSPHLSTARERIVLTGEMIGENTFATLADDVEDAAAELDASFFEKMIAMAFLAFARARVDVGVVEVGLGGRLDATNLCVPRACAITRLGLDHVELLGPTLAHIAREKAGICKAGVPVVIGPQEQVARDVVVEIARRVGAPVVHAEVDESLFPSLAGAHQRENASVAAELVRQSGLAVPPASIRRGARTATWPGRYELVRARPPFVLDGAHNPTAAAALVATATKDPRLSGRLTLIVGMTAGHDALDFANALRPLAPARVLGVASRSPRTQAAGEVARALARVFGSADACSLDEAIAISRRTPTLLTGSLYLVGEARQRLLGGEADPVLPLF